jgi:hypothetical protein
MLLATKHSKWARTEQQIDHRKDPFMALPVDLQAAPARAPQSATRPHHREHSITSSARASNVGGTSSPKALAVLRSVSQALERIRQAFCRLDPRLREAMGRGGGGCGTFIVHAN